MRHLMDSIILFLFLICTDRAASAINASVQDTSAINLQTREALNGARRNPDVSIFMAHKALSISEKTGYSKGMADACLALCTSYLAKYNKGDSAHYYGIKACDLYKALNDTHGQGRACYALAYVFSFKGDLKESERYSMMSLGFFEQSGDTRGMINSFNALSYLAKQRKDFDKARNLIERAIELAQSVKDTLQMADATNNLGNIYKDMALFGRAIDSYFDALRLWEAKRDSSGIALAYGSIGLMYYYQKDLEKALEFNFLKLPLSEASGDYWEVSKTCNNIADIYNSQSQHDSALCYLRKSLRLNIEMSYPGGIASSYHDFASTFLLKKNLDSASFYINEAVSLAGEINDPALVEYYITMGRIYQAKEENEPALHYALQAYNLAKVKNLPLVISDAAILLSDLYSNRGNDDIAFRYLKEHKKLKDSISNDEFLKQITRMEIQYDFDKRQKAAEFEQLQQRLIQENKIKQQRTYLKGLVVLSFLIALISLFIIRHNRLRSRYARIDLEQRLLRAQLNPHFIFNSLCAVQDFILSGKPVKANAFLTKIARLMRNILENSREEFIPLEKEIETLRYYMDIQQLRFDTGFEYNIDVDKSIDTENVSVPPMLAQPCVENSIEHGLLPLKENGRIHVSYTLKDGLIMLVVTDNGLGRVKADDIKSNMNFFFIDSTPTEKRLEHFRKTLKEKNISYEIIDLYKEGTAAGTKVVMMLPFKRIYV